MTYRERVAAERSELQAKILELLAGQGRPATGREITASLRPWRQVTYRQIRTAADQLVDAKILKRVRIGTANQYEVLIPAARAAVGVPPAAPADASPQPSALYWLVYELVGLLPAAEKRILMGAVAPSEQDQLNESHALRGE